MVETRERVLERYETELFGLSLIILDGVIETIFEDGEVGHSFIDSDGVTAAAAMTRALLPVQLSGRDVRFLRKALGLSGAELARQLDITASTLSRWESGAQPLGGFAEKVLRELVCVRLRARAPGIAYDPAMVIDMRARKLESGESLPAITLRRTPLLREQAGGARVREETWERLPEAA